MNVTVTVRLLHDVVSRHPPPATRLSVVERTRSDDEQTRRVASATIIEAYWRPVYKYLRMKWSLGPDEAADLTQEFFTTTLEKDIVERDDSTRARFRTYLRLCPDGFASNARKAERRLKRGGGVTLVPLDFQTATIGDLAVTWLSDGRSFYVMKLVGGRRLDEVLADRAPQALRLELFARVREATEFIGRNAAQPWLCYLAFNAVHAPLQATPERLERLAAIADPKRRTFAAMLSAMDDAIGTVLATVRERGLENDTLIVFLSDNGGPTPSITSGNGPLRGFKSQTWEGGIRVPFLMQWKGRIPAGGVDDRPVIQLDILPTALAAAGIPLPADAAIDGVNLLPYVTGQNDRDPHEALYWRFGPQLALRQGDWKLVKAPGGGVEGDPRDGRANTRDAELYNLHDDIGETRNLAAKHPEKVRELVAAWERIDTGMIDPLWFDGAAERGTASP